MDKDFQLFFIPVKYLTKPMPELFCSKNEVSSPDWNPCPPARYQLGRPASPISVGQGTWI